MARMTKLLLQLQAAVAADRRHGGGLGLGFAPGPGRRHPLTPRHASATGRFAPSCLVLCLLALAAAATTLALALTLHRHGPDPDAAVGSPSGFAVVINTWRRHALLRRSVAHYAACAGVDAVHVVWSEPRPPPEHLLRGVLNGTRRGNVRFEINEADSLNNRFRPIRGLKSDAVFSVDDDLIVPCSTLRFAFDVWRSAPSAMVGFVPRMHWLADPEPLSHIPVLDISAGRIFEIGSGGISSLKGHSLQRSRCLNAFSAMYGHMPLVATTVKAVDSRRSWFW
ncbi:Glycosyltransferase family 64 protein C4 [Dichanthelium oligosanthes]|uniref:Glycosyltransferase family 64 protein C4 n=1 Tax=Dichanthelium oligosanthes TaxID=888268 RepID=A0A1E5UYF2_9POAL|nr:Glycosyltransferase family 64 protein C4 [Dichanthelium oligosanthes]